MKEKVKCNCRCGLIGRKKGFFVLFLLGVVRRKVLKRKQEVKNKWIMYLND